MRCPSCGESIRVKREMRVQLWVGRMRKPPLDFPAKTLCLWFDCAMGHRGWMIYQVTFHPSQKIARARK